MVENTIEKNIRSLTDEELVEIIDKDFDEYTDKAIDYVKDELKIRNISIDEFKKRNISIDANPSKSKNKIWFYEFKGERKGPVSREEIIKLLDSQVLNRKSLVWKKDFENWKAIQETQFEDNISMPPPLNGRLVKNHFVWLLAFAPLLGISIQGVVSEVIGIKAESLWFTTLALNLILSWLDVTKLKRAGHNMENLLGYFWLVPVYLYKRSKLLKHKFSYLIVWIISFIISLA